MSASQSARSFFSSPGVSASAHQTMAPASPPMQRQREEMRLEEPLEALRAKDLRREVYRLGLKIARSGSHANDHKSGYIELLRSYREEERRARPAPRTPQPPLPPQPKGPEPEVRGDLTFRLLDLMLSEENWRSVNDFYKAVAQKNKSMISDTVTAPSFDLYGPQQSVEGSRFWRQMADAMAAIGRKTTPDALFDAWKRVCEAYNGKKLPSSRGGEGEVEKREVLYLLSKLRDCLGLVPCATIGSYFKTFDPIVPPPPPSGEALSIANGRFEGSEDSEEVRSDGDSSASDAADATAATDASQSTDAAEDPPLLEMKRAFWRCRGELARQQLATARLQHDMQRAALLEQRLSGAKRKIAALRCELRAATDGAAAQEAAAELSVYERERSQLLAALRRRALPP